MINLEKLVKDLLEINNKFNEKEDDIDQQMEIEFALEEGQE